MVKMWDVLGGGQRGSLDCHGVEVYALAFSPDGKTLASAARGDILLWDMEPTVGNVTFHGHTGRVFMKLLDGELEERDLAQIRDSPRASLHGHSSKINSLAYSCDGVLLASGADDQSIILWDSTSGEQQAALHGHTGDVKAVAFSPDSTVLATGSEDRTAKLWDVGSKEVRATLSGHSGEVSTVAFSADGLTLVTGSGDETVNVWQRRVGLRL